MTDDTRPEWIAIDWGTSNLRAYAMQGSRALTRRASDQGMAGLVQNGFAPVLLALVQDWLRDGPVPMIACGMVGARQGWVEAPYRPVPCAPVAGPLTAATLRERQEVHIVPGLSQASPPDVMRGEETQIAGFLSLNPDWDGVLCLPGTHTKWVHLSAGEVVSFQTFMTGEIFALLCTQSVLRHSAQGTGWDDAAFDAAVSDTLSAPERLAARLFTLRAADLLHGKNAAQTRAALSGYLIGTEIAAARPYWLGQNLAILGMGAQARAYQNALAPQGVPALLVDSDRATLAGLTAAYQAWKETI